MNLKSCSCCREFKPLAEFVHDKSNKTGRHHRCLQCERKRSAERLKNGKLAAVSKRYRATHPQKVKAHRAVNGAVKKGILKREPCLNCKRAVEPKTHHFHHDDDFKELDVKGFCLWCHFEYERLKNLYPDDQELFSFFMEMRAA